MYRTTYRLTCHSCGKRVPWNDVWKNGEYSVSYKTSRCGGYASIMNSNAREIENLDHLMQMYEIS